MHKLLILAGIALVTATSPALANQCPQQIAALDDMLRQHGSMLSADQAAKARQLRAEAEEAHKAGRHDAAMGAIEQAHQAIGM